MKINLKYDTVSPDADLKLVESLAEEMGEEYHIPKKEAFHLVWEHMDDLCTWIHQRKNIVAKGWKIGDLAYGVELTECPELTMLILSK